MIFLIKTSLKHQSHPPLYASIKALAKVVNVNNLNNNKKTNPKK
jgi:hypothetical protein